MKGLSLPRLRSGVSWTVCSPGSIMAAAVRLLHVVSLLLLSSLSAAVSSRRDVLELRDTDFDYLAAEHETMLVKFYAPW